MAIPVVSTPGLQASAKGVAINALQIVATESPTLYKADNLPNGLQVNLTTGVISGTPNKVESKNVRVVAVNASGQSRTVEFPWIITKSVTEAEEDVAKATTEKARTEQAKAVEKANQSSSWVAPSGWGVRR